MEKHPPNWRWMPLDSICIGIYDCPHSTPKLTLEGPYVARTQDVITGVFRSDGAAHVSQETYKDRIKRAEPSYGDLLYSREGTYFGIAAEVPSGVQVCLGQRMVLIRPDAAHVDHRFLRYWLNSPVMSAHVHGQRDGSVAERLNLPTIRALPIPLPDSREQRRIAMALGALDDKIAVNERIAATADELTHALFTREFLASATPVPQDGWVSGHLSDICSTQYGYTASSSSEPVGPKFLRVKDINKRNWVNWADVPYCEISERDLEKYQLSLGDVLVARMADPGKSAIVEESTDSVFASYLVRLKTPSLAHSYFVWGFLKSDAYADYAESARGGSVQANMNAKVIVGAQLSIPPVEVMQQYLRLIAPVRQRLTLALRESQSLAALRDTLLPQLMSGRLRVKDAEKIVEDHT
ncbi:restriction endonuclease subunit S [Streptomyces sp. NPDC051677]|uniref:restriction endonuclease subunit S n=1 Tax=Streptomyces sp. NPDC051677 TaxID=3365669 RepID=UPI0037D620BB